MMPRLVRQPWTYFQSLHSLTNGKHNTDSEPYTMSSRTFHHFRQLPIELQIGIIMYVICDPVNEHHQLFMRGFWNFHTVGRPWQHNRSWHLCLTGPKSGMLVVFIKDPYGEPSAMKSVMRLMRTCRLSRELVLRWWMKKIAETGVRTWRQLEPHKEKNVLAVFAELIEDLSGGPQ